MKIPDGVEEAILAEFMGVVSRKRGELDEKIDRELTHHDGTQSVRQ